MKRMLAVVVILLSSVFAAYSQTTAAADINLPAPQKNGGRPLLDALAERCTTRNFAAADLTRQQLSTLLWAAFGVNRAKMPHDGKPGRTAPSARNAQEVDLYVLLSDGAYLYEPVAHRLKLVTAGDVRSKLLLPQAAQAAVTILLAADSDQRFAQVDTGFIGQNIYLYAAANNLNAWFYVAHDEEGTIASTLHLPKGKQPLYYETVGLPPTKQK